MAKKEELHTLIQSLSKSEKRYFKVFAGRESSGSNYLKLFDAIDRQSEYDEAAIKQQFQGETFLRQLHVTKNYLRKIILKSLRNFHSGGSRNAQLMHILQNVEILYNKELYKLSFRELEKAERIARDYELPSGLVEVAGWKRKLTQVLQPHHYELIQETLDVQAEAIKLLDNKNKYWRLATGISRELLIEEETTENHTLLEDPGQALTLEAKVLYYNSKYLNHLQEDRIDEAEQALKTLVALLEEKKERMEEDPGLYVSSVNNLVSFLVFTRQYEQALTYIQKAKELYNNWDITMGNHILLKQVLRTLNIELEIYRDEKLAVEKTGFIESTEELVMNNKNKMPKEYLLSFWFQFGSIHFMGGDFARAQHWINCLLNARFKGLRNDLQIQARMLNLMIHLEQQNLMVLRHHVDSTRRYMKKVKEVQPFEKILLQFFIKIGRLPLLEYKSAFRELKDQLFPDDSEPLIPQDVLGYIDYREWINGKLNARD